MSTFIKTVPVPHATKRTTGIWILDDGRIGTRVENPAGTTVLANRTDKDFNFSTWPEGTSQVIVNNEPVTFVSVQKLGADARFIISVELFYNETLEGTAIPQSQFLWYPYTTDEKDAPPDTEPQTASPSNPTYVFWSSGGTPAAPTLAFGAQAHSVGIETQWSIQGTTKKRRRYLADLILNQINHPNMNQWLAFNTLTFGGDALDEIVDLQKVAMLSYMPEMLARAISVDSNLATQAKFNLLEGMAQINLGEMVSGINNALVVAITNRTRNSNSWTFYRIGNVGSAPTYTYTRPDWNHVDHSTEITMAGTASIGTDWQSYLRNLEG